MIVSRTKTKDKGFTLTELLVVIFIMVILMGIGALSIMQNNTGRGLNAGMSTLEAAINEARSVAMNKGTRARMLINNDATDSSKFGRQIVTMYNANPASDSDPAQAEDWQPAFRSVSLPPNVFFDSTQVVSVLDDAGGYALGALGANSAGNFSRSQTNNNNLYIEFNRLGICTIEPAAGGVPNTPGASLVLVNGRFSAGSMVPTGDEKAGIVVWRNGGTTKVNDVSQIN